MFKHHKNLNSSPSQPSTPSSSSPTLLVKHLHRVKACFLVASVVTNAKGTKVNDTDFFDINTTDETEIMEREATIPTVTYGRVDG